ncbi:MAG: hypothetical protein CME70_18915 [Halobacteriovorax sp.]|nr:hypothetical protein [Halobacteriovorax sp.]
MTLTDMINNLHTLDDRQLRDLNGSVLEHLRSIRDRQSAVKRRTLHAGDKVSWTGRNGYTEGVIVRVKRKKAICSVGHGQNWDVPLSMLQAI